MKKFYISDLHFGHKNIIAAEGRPFASVEEMERTLIQNWNCAVTPKDIVYILGDFCWEKADRWVEILQQLNGSKCLIRGNHDLKQMPPQLSQLFQEIADYREVNDSGYHLILCHYPIMTYANDSNPKVIMLHGHTHNSREQDFVERWTAELRRAKNRSFHSCGNIINVGCMRDYMGYTPRTLEEILTSTAPL